MLAAFDGAFRDVSVILNGHIMGRHHYGYTPFQINLTPCVKPGKKNRLSVLVSNDAEPNSRWYPGGGLYRHVDLLTAPEIHIAPDGIYAYTSHIVGADAFITVETEVENPTAEDADLWVNLCFRKTYLNEDMAESETIGARARTSTTIDACGAVKVQISAGSSAAARTQVMIENAEIWDIDHPNLYQITAQLVTARPTSHAAQMEVLDEEETTFGIRTISVDAKNGFMLNGRTVKLKGGCIHHDNGILGAASYWDSEYRKVKLHKENGFLPFL